jgi:hypothetical protein
VIVPERCIANRDYAPEQLLRERFYGGQDPVSPTEHGVLVEPETASGRS